MPECGIAFQVLCEKIPCGFELLADETEAEEPSPHCIFGILNLRLFGAGGLDHHRHLAQCEAKLDVAFQFPCVKPAPTLCVGVCKLEASEFHRSVGEAGVVVEHMVTAAVVMPVPAFVGVILVPNVCKGVHCLGLLAVQPFEEIMVDRPAVAVDSALVKP